MIELKLKNDFAKVLKVQEKEQDKLLDHLNVSAIGVGEKITNGAYTGEPSLTIFVQSKIDKALISSSELLPKTIGGVKTDIIESGQIFAQSDITLRKKIRPAEGGYSVGHYKITAGTIATSVVDSRPTVGIPPRYYILSNNHVLANSNDAHLGDPIYQPGPFDGGNKKCTIAKLARFVPIDFNGHCNYVDAALAEGDFCDLDREIYWNGYVNNVVQPQVGLIVKKTGRTTGNTKERIIAVNATVNVNYGDGKVAKFCRQFVCGNMSAGGDSGSLVLDEQNNAIGLLFAGSNTITICNDIRYVQSLLGFRFR